MIGILLIIFNLLKMRLMQFKNLFSVQIRIAAPIVVSNRLKFPSRVPTTGARLFVSALVQFFPNAQFCQRIRKLFEDVILIDRFSGAIVVVSKMNVRNEICLNNCISSRTENVPERTQA